MAKSYRKVPAYNPLKDSEYMSFSMRRYFQNKLHEELEKLIEKERKLSLLLQESANREPDLIDQSTAEESRFNCHAYQEHEMYLRHKVELALRRMKEGTYGYCMATGSPIGVNRLIVVPYAMYCFDVQAEKEKNHSSAHFLNCRYASRL